MIKKLNWGYGIVLSFVVFAAGIFVMAYISVTTKVDLVTEDYYEKELKYQSQIDNMNNSNDLHHKVQVSVEKNAIAISYPNIGSHERYHGSIVFFRPSDKSVDQLFPVKVDADYSQKIALSPLIRGLWRVKITWQIDHQQYYFEQPVIIQ